MSNVNNIHIRGLSSQPCIIVFIVALNVFFGFCLHSTSLALTFPQDFDYSNRIEVLLDKGELWNVNSIFHPLDIPSQNSTAKHLAHQDGFRWVRSYLDEYSRFSFRLRESSSDGMSALLMPGLIISAQSGVACSYEKLALRPFIWSEARFNRSWYACLYFRATNESASLPHYSGIPRNIARAGMNTGEIDQSVIGYQNSWAQVEYGRNREIIGPMVEENLILSGNAPSWDRLMIQVNHRNFAYRWFYGFLEALPDAENIQRYIVGRALEYRNRKNLVLGLGEVSILAGPKRPLDLTFLNPLALHLEMEQNKRTNSINNHQNAIWFLHFDWLILQSLRFSGSAIIDEIKFERQEIQEGETDNLGWLGRVAWTPETDNIGVTFFSSYARINTYTMQHIYPYCNFVTRNQLIGHPLGNDADQINGGVRITTSYLPVLLEFEYGRIRWGDNSLKYNPYQPFEKFGKGSFPSGQIRTNRYLSLRLNSQPIAGLSVIIDGHIDLKHSGKDSALEAWTFSARYQIPLLITNN